MGEKSYVVQPEEIGIKGHLHSNSDSEKKSLETKIAKEMFKGITREVVEETGIPASFLVNTIPFVITRSYKTFCCFVQDLMHFGSIN